MAATEAVCCDLLTALVDSWSLWERVAGDGELGRRWRESSLRLVTGSGRYRPYDPIVAEAAREVGLPGDAAAELLRRWPELRPYPDSVPALRELAAAGLPLVVVTNTSRAFAEIAAAKLAVPWTAVVSAESSGWYKPAREAYEAGVAATGRPREAVLFVAGSAHDVSGAEAAGLGVYWVNRRGLPVPAGTNPEAIEPTLARLSELALG